MNSIRLASVVASFAFGLVGYGSQAFAQSPGAGVDPSSVYQPSPNSRPLAVQPPVSVTGAVGGNLRTAPAKPSAVASYDASSVYQPSPNSRPLAVQPPVSVTGVVGSAVRVVPVQAAKVAPKVQPVAQVSTTHTTAATFYNPSPNERPVLLVAPLTPAPAHAQGAAMALNDTTASPFYQPSPNYKPVVPAAPSDTAAQQRTAALRVSASEGLPGISPNLR